MDNVTLYDQIRACYLTYVNEKNITMKMYYLELLKEYIKKEKEINAEKKLYNFKG